MLPRSRRVRSRVATALRMAANSLHHAKDYLGEFFRRITRKLGKPQAITAAAHKLARIVYHPRSTTKLTTKPSSTAATKTPSGALSTDSGNKPPNWDFNSSPYRTGDVPWESAWRPRIRNHEGPQQGCCKGVSRYLCGETSYKSASGKWATTARESASKKVGNYQEISCPSSKPRAVVE